MRFKISISLYISAKISKPMPSTKCIQNIPISKNTVRMFSAGLQGILTCSATNLFVRYC